MPLVQCLTGEAKPYVGGVTYTFRLDAAGRYVAEVGNERALSLLLSAGTYVLADPLAAAPEVAPEPGSGDGTGDDTTPPIDPALLQQGGRVDPAIVAEIENAEVPKILRKLVKGVPTWFAVEAWPLTTAGIPAELARAIEDGVMPFLAIDPATGGLDIIVENGTAYYTPAGTDGTSILYRLADDSKWEPMPKDPELIDVKGIGEAMLAKLATQGITTLEQLVAVDAAKLASLVTELKVKDTAVTDWIHQAKALLEA